MCDVLQKPLRRIEIVEVSGGAEHLPAGSSPVIQDAVREAEERSSPLSTSPTAKMIKMGEPAEVSSQSPEPSGPRSEGPAQEAGAGPAPPPLCCPPPTDTELPPPPSNSFQLEAQLHTIGNQPEVVYRYLRVSRTGRNGRLQTLEIQEMSVKYLHLHRGMIESSDTVKRQPRKARDGHT